MSSNVKLGTANATIDFNSIFNKYNNIGVGSHVQQVIMIDYNRS